MNIQEFASENRLKMTFPSNKRIAPDSEPVVEGKCGMIGDGFSGEGPFLLLHLLAVARHANMDSKLTRRGKVAEEAGMRLKVRSGAESVWYFDPSDATQAQAAIAWYGKTSTHSESDGRAACRIDSETCNRSPEGIARSAEPCRKGIYLTIGFGDR